MIADLDGIIVSQFYGDNSGGAEFDTDGDGTPTQEDEFVAIENTTGAAVDVSGWQIWSDSSGTGAPDPFQNGQYHTFPPGTILPAGTTLYIVNEITGTAPYNMQEASEGGVESGAGGINTNLLSEGNTATFSEGIALVNPVSGNYIVVELSGTALTDFPSMPGFTGTTLVGSTNAALQSSKEDQNAGSSYQYNSITDQYFYSAAVVVCFAAGTLIAVPGGTRKVEDLTPGDPVLTLDHGVQRLRKTLRRDLDFTQGDDPAHKPIEFKPGALGPSTPSHPLVVSPQHRILVTGLESGPDHSEMLVPAKALLARPGVRVMEGRRTVTYIHLVFSRHEVINAHGCWSESFYPGAYVTATFEPRLRLELMRIFPDLKRNKPVKAARPLQKVGQMCDALKCPDMPIIYPKQPALMTSLP